MTARVLARPNNWGIRLDGTINGNVAAAASASLNNQQFTIALWVMLKGPFLGASGATVSTGPLIAYDGNNTPNFRVTAVTGQQAATLQLVDAGVTVMGTALCRIGEWQHVACTYDAVGTWCMYVNGAQKSTGSYLPSGAPKAWVYGALFPRLGRTGVLYSQILADDVTIVNRAISAAEMESLYAAGTLPSGTVLRWEFEEGVGSTTADRSGNGNTGTLDTGATFAVSRPYDQRSAV